MDGQNLYIVTAKAPRGVITYRCPTPVWALKKARDFVKAEYKEISIVAPDGEVITEANLASIVARHAESDSSTQLFMMAHSE